MIAETARRPDGTRQKDQTQPATESVARAGTGKARPDYTRQLSYRFLPRDDRRRTFLPEDKRDRYLAAGGNLRIMTFRSRFAGIAKGGAFLRGRALFDASLLSPRELGLNESGRALLGCLPRRRANAGNCASFHLAADAAESRLQTENVGLGGGGSRWSCIALCSMVMKSLCFYFACFSSGIPFC